jgi:DNA mismatch repair protein MutS2
MSSWEQAAPKLEFEKIRQRLLRYASSAPGREALMALPVSTELGEIRSEQERVSEMKRLLELEEPLSLEGVHPVSESASKAAIDGMMLSARELLHILLSLRSARLVRAHLAKHQSDFPLLWEIGESVGTDKVLEYNIDQAIDESGAVKANASRELQNIRRAVADRYDDLRKRLASILRSVTDQGFSQDEIITTREGRMVIPVKSEHKFRVPGFIHSASSSGATVFIEPTETLELNNEIRSLGFQEQREIERILRAITAQVGERKILLQGNLRLLATLDSLQARARYSLEIVGVAPDFAPGGRLTIIEARHPLLLMHHGRAETIPLSLSIGDGTRTLLISGPNAGGKSVAMKCVGTIVIMAQSGMHIPAAEGTTLPVFDSLFVDVGDDQSIENDLSTFSSHLSHLKEIAGHAGNNSLVLIDEIGSGTDPSEGGAIAAAFLEMLTLRGCLTIATTHQGNLKVFAHNTPGMGNGAMEFDQTTLQPTYRFLSGVPGSSYALAMAERMGFPRDVMTRAGELQGDQHTRLESLVGELESAVQKARADRDAAEAERKRLQDLVGEYETRNKKLSAEIREVKKKAVDEAEAVVRNANALIENTVKEIREHQASKETVREVRSSVNALQSELRTLQHDLELPPAASVVPPVGSLVSFVEGGEAGELVELSADGRTAIVLVGSIKMRVPAGDLKPAHNRSRAPRWPSADSGSEKPAEVRRDLDLRGMTGEEALPLVDKFIDDAMLAGLHRVDIIHGKGTGALRKKVTDFLSTHPRVKAFRLGEWNEGGTGATVVELVED